jgi:hypothetical protein
LDLTGVTLGGFYLPEIDGLQLNIDGLDLSIGDFLNINGDFDLKIGRDLGLPVFDFSAIAFSGKIGFDGIDFLDILNGDFFNLSLNGLTWDFEIDGLTVDFPNLPFLSFGNPFTLSGFGSPDFLKLNLADIDLIVDDYARLSGDFDFEFNRDATGQRSFQILGTDVDAFLGEGAGTLDIADDIGVGLTNADFRLNVNPDNTFSYCHCW